MNPCGTTQARIYEQTTVNEIPIYFGAGVSPVNSRAQFFVAWGKGVLAGGLIHTFNQDGEREGYRWYVDEEEAEAEYQAVQVRLGKR